MASADSGSIGWLTKRFPGPSLKVADFSKGTTKQEGLGTERLYQFSVFRKPHHQRGELGTPRQSQTFVEPTSAIVVRGGRDGSLGRVL